VATVTETLRYALQSAVRAQPGAPGGVSVTTGRPVDPAAGAGPSINIFLYQVTPNPFWRNDDVPTREASGRIIQRPRAAIDLHYLLSFYGEDIRQDAQQLLGIAVRTLHSEPTLSRDLIRAAVAAASRNFLADSNLADAIELVRFCLSPLNLEELSKLWSVFFQTPYALSVGYEGSVVLVETEDVPLPVLPVLDRNVYVIPIRLPVINQVIPDTGLGWPIIPGSRLVIEGEKLMAPPGQATRVLIDGVDQIANLAKPGTDSSLTFQLQQTLPAPLNVPPPVISLAAGAHFVQVQHVMQMGVDAPPGTHTGPESNLAAFVLRPRVVGPITVANRAGTGTAPRSGDVGFSIDPPLANGQTAALVLMAMSTGTPFRFPIPIAPATVPPAPPPPPPPGNPLTVPVAGLPPDTYYVQMEVDGVTSPFERAPATGLFSGPQVSFA
jgi:hypothetical protein